jgi:hypothetical protein
MKRSIAPPPPLPEAITSALQAVSLAQAAVRDAQGQVSATYKSALRERETRVAAAIFPILERLQTARGVATFARMRLQGLARNINAREERRVAWERKKKLRS